MYTDDLNLSLAVVASFTAAKHICDFDKVRMNFNLLVANDEEMVLCKKTLAAILWQNGFKPNGLQCPVHVVNTLESLNSYMMKTNLFLLPLKSYSLQFGSEALLAVASGVPILISNSCGLAPLMEKLDAGKPVADDTFDDESDVDKMWKDRILELLLNPEEAQLRANRLR